MKSSSAHPSRVGLIGYGAIGRRVAEALISGDAGHARLSAVLVRDTTKYAEAARYLEEELSISFTDDADTFFNHQLDLIVEAAGQGAVRAYAQRCLTSGADLLISSIGAFTDDTFYTALQELAKTKGRRLLLVSGALPGVDWMQGAALAEVYEVVITQSKPVASWRNTPAEALVDLSTLREPTCFFTGSAREAASRFSKSSNITAMLALATVGLDATQVRLVADPTSDTMHTEITFDGAAGSVCVVWQGVPSDDNPSTSADVPLSVVKAIRNLTSHMHLGV